MEIAIGILSSVISAVTAAIFVYEFKEHDSSHRERETRRQEEYDALKDGMQAILRDRIIFLCEKNESIGYCPIPTTENIGMMYAAYHKLGGNGIVTQLYDEVKSMPHTPRKEGST